MYRNKIYAVARRSGENRFDYYVYGQNVSVVDEERIYPAGWLKSKITKYISQKDGRQFGLHSCDNGALFRLLRDADKADCHLAL